MQPTITQFSSSVPPFKVSGSKVFERQNAARAKEGGAGFGETNATCGQQILSGLQVLINQGLIQTCELVP
jgi:hypothetical protein